jgi:ribosomal protein S18 acetylase RimI-like enzyme
MRALLSAVGTGGDMQPSGALGLGNRRSAAEQRAELDGVRLRFYRRELRETQVIDTHIRDARIEDAAMLAEAQRVIARTPGRLASVPSELKDELFRERILRLSGSECGKFIVIETGGEVAGHALLDPLKLAVTAHVVDLTIAVHPGFQGRGLGKQLLSHLIEWARANPKVERMELRVRSVNTIAIALYKKLGFVEEGRMRRRLKLGPDSYVDDLVMGLWVGP